MTRKPILAASLVLSCAAAVSSVGGAASAASAPAAVGPACTTTQTIELTSLIWQPPSVLPGQSSRAIATALNCTGVPQQASEQWLGRFVGPTGNFPPGCPVIDPLILSVNLPPHGSATSSVGYLVPSGCTATGLVVTVEVIQQGKVIAQRSADLIIK